MAAKKITPKMAPKKPAGGKPKDNWLPTDTYNGVLAREAAIGAGSKYMNSPMNRSQVIMPQGVIYPTGSDGYYMNTKGRYRAADKVMKKTYNKTKAELDRSSPEGKKKVTPSVTKASTKGKKKK